MATGDANGAEAINPSGAGLMLCTAVKGAENGLLENGGNARILQPMDQRQTLLPQAIVI